MRLGKTDRGAHPSGDKPMRTHLLSLAATLTVVGFATTSVAVPLSSASSGGSTGAVSAPSGGGGSSSGSSSGSGGASSGSSSHGGGGGGGAGGAAHAGGFGGGATYRGGGFETRSGPSGYRSFASQGRDMAHGGYQVLAARPANVTAGAAIPVLSDHSALKLGPALGSAAEAARRNDDKRRVLPKPISYPRHAHGLHEVDLLQRFATCPPLGCNVPREMCPPLGMLKSPIPTI